MRKKERIRPMLEEIATIWEENFPDFRFGQLIVDVFGNIDIFFIEDDKFLEGIRKFTEELKKSKNIETPTNPLELEDIEETKEEVSE